MNNQILKLQLIANVLQERLQQQTILNQHHQRQHPIITPSHSNPHSQLPTHIKTQSQLLQGSNQSISYSIEQSPYHKKGGVFIEERVDCSLELTNLSNEIIKILSMLPSKEPLESKSFLLSTPKRNSSTKLIPKTSGIHKSNPRISILKNKSLKSEPALSQKQQLKASLGDLSLIINNDEIVSNLISNLQKQEQKYVELVLKANQEVIRHKMKNLMQRLWQKNEQKGFKLKQQQASMIQSSKNKNKEVIKSGYTAKMKEWIQRNKFTTIIVG